MKTIHRKAIALLPIIVIALSSFVGCKTTITLEERGKWEVTSKGTKICVSGGNECTLGGTKIEIDAPGFDDIVR